MACVITEPCMGARDKACVAVCPVDCIHEGPEMLFINPAECICCGACIDPCPVNAIFYEDEVPDRWKSYVRKNAEFFEKGEPCLCHPTGDHPQASSISD